MPVMGEEVVEIRARGGAWVTWSERGKKCLQGPPPMRRPPKSPFG